METLIFVIIILFASMFLMGIGVLFFNRTASRSACGVDPTVEKRSGGCASGDAGICPMEEPTGALKMAIRTKIVSGNARDNKPN